MSGFPNMMAALDAIDDGGSLWTAMIAALGDEPLFMECEHAKAETPCDPLCEAYVQGEGMIQVWPRRNDDK